MEFALHQHGHRATPRQVLERLGDGKMDDFIKKDVGKILGVAGAAGVGTLAFAGEATLAGAAAALLAPEILGAVGVATVGLGVYEMWEHGHGRSGDISIKDVKNFMLKANGMTPLNTAPKNDSGQVPGAGNASSAPKAPPMQNNPNEGPSVGNGFAAAVNGPGSQQTSAVDMRQVFTQMNTHAGSGTQDMTWQNAFNFKINASVPIISDESFATTEGSYYSSPQASAPAVPANAGKY